MSAGSDELLLYAVNTGSLFPQRRQIEKTLARFKKAGTFQKSRAVVLFMPWFNEAARLYQREIEPRRFTRADKQIASREMVARFEAEFAIRPQDFEGLGAAFAGFFG